MNGDLNPAFVEAVGKAALAYGWKSPAAVGWFILAVAVFTVINTCVGTWRKLAGPEKAALAESNWLLRGISKGSSAMGIHPVKAIDMLTSFWCGALNTVARLRSLPIPYPPEDRAILTSKPGEAPTVVVVMPAEKVTVPAVVPPAAVADAVAMSVRSSAVAEAEAERRAAAEREERLP